MKQENGHRKDEAAAGAAGLESQVANAVGELLRAQQLIELQKRTFEERDAEIVARERAIAQHEEDARLRQARLDDVTTALQQRAVELDALASDASERGQRLAAREAELTALDSELAARADELARRLAALEEKEGELSAVGGSHRDLESREREQQERERRIEEREQELAARETRLLELGDREAAVEHDTRALALRADTLAAAEAALGERCEEIERRELSIQQFCSVLSGMAHALQDPCPEKLEAARAAADAIAGERLRLAPPERFEAPRLGASNPSSDTREGADHTPATALHDEGPADVSDFSEEELQRFGMLRKLGTATDREIAESIRAQRGSFPTGKRRKRRWAF